MTATDDSRVKGSTNESQIGMTAGGPRSPNPIGRSLVGGRKRYELCDYQDCNQAAEFICNQEVEALCGSILLCANEGFRGCKKKVCITHVSEHFEDVTKTEETARCKNCDYEHDSVQRGNMCKIGMFGLISIVLLSMVMMLII